jgi:cation diffusion facilitator family transporter
LLTAFICLTHAGALLIAELAYTYSRRYANDARLTFGTGKFGDLAAFTSAIALAMIALLIGYESIDRLVNPIPIAFNQAIPIAVVGLGVNLLSAFILREDHDHHHGHAHEHDHHDHAQLHRDHNIPRKRAPAPRPGRQTSTPHVGRRGCSSLMGSRA